MQIKCPDEVTNEKKKKKKKEEKDSGQKE